MFERFSCGSASLTPFPFLHNNGIPSTLTVTSEPEQVSEDIEFMNLYILLRVIFYSLLVVNNLLALTAASWSISTSKASPGAVLVIVGCVAFVVLTITTWVEACALRTQLSRVRTEVILVPILVVFQLISAGVVTSDTVNSTCRDPSSCVALVVLSWLTPFSLLVYFLMVLAITFDHAKVDPSIWDASFFDHPWFLKAPPKENNQPFGRSTITPPVSLLMQPTLVDYPRQCSLWMPPSSRAPSLNDSVPSRDPSLQDTRGSAKYPFLPRWAKDLRPLQRGKELPFPVAAPHRRYSNLRRIDAPVSPTLYTENF